MAIDKTEMMKIVQDKLTGVDNEQDTKKNLEKQLFRSLYWGSLAVSLLLVLSFVVSSPDPTLSRGWSLGTRLCPLVLKLHICQISFAVDLIRQEEFVDSFLHYTETAGDFWDKLKLQTQVNAT